MSTTVTCEDVLVRPRPGDHAAQLYMDSESLAAALAVYVRAGLEAGEAIVALAAQPHIDRLMARLKRAGLNPHELVQSGQLICRDAETVLEAIVRNGQPDHTAFRHAVVPLIEQAAGFGGLRMYGELVDIFWQRNDRAAAHQLERWWNALLAEHEFMLLCGYRANVFDDRVQSGLHDICATHTHLIPVMDCERLERALDLAIQELLPLGDVTGLRQTLLDRCQPSTRMPPAQAVLFGLQTVLPSLAQDVCIRVHEHYHRPNAVAPALAE